jgi:hypothetical protein
VIADVSNGVIRGHLTARRPPPTANRVAVKPFHWNKPMK